MGVGGDEEVVMVQLFGTDVHMVPWPQDFAAQAEQSSGGQKTSEQAVLVPGFGKVALGHYRQVVGFRIGINSGGESIRDRPLAMVFRPPTDRWERFPNGNLRALRSLRCGVVDWMCHSVASALTPSIDLTRLVK